MNIDVNPHTVILLIGPSNCGKTYFTEHTLIPQLKALSPLPNTATVNVSHISSDAIRRELLGDPEVDKYSPAMDNVSGPAFDVLRARLRAAVAFPVNSEFVIVDTKGTYEPFINEVVDIARSACYNVLPIIFQYDDINLHYESTHGVAGKLITKDLRKIKLETRRALAKLKLKSVTIKDRTTDFTVTSTNHGELAKLIASNDDELLVIGDVHGCYDELVQLLDANNVKVDENGVIVENTYGKHIVLAGDYVDKGPKVVECINFVHANIDNPRFSVVVGNHEHRLFRELTDGLAPLTELAPFFDTHDRIVDDEAVVNKFLEAHRKAVPWVMNDFAVVTHAPCSVKHLGKIDDRSKRAARYISYKLTEDNIADLVNKLVSGDVGQYRHIFGHIATSTPGERVDNRILIDGGCVVGGQLCSVSIAANRRVYVNSVKSSQPVSEQLVRYGRPVREVRELSPDALKRVHRAAAGKVNFISGTMTPTPVDAGQLETIDAAVAYFKSNGVNDVVVQPKFMGSRANVYLHRDPTQSYTVSRNGFVVSDRVDLSGVYATLADRLFNLKEFASAEVIVLDGELMPWSALGAGLVDIYRQTGADARADTEFLKATGFEAKLTTVVNELNETNFNVDRCETPKKQLIKTYGQGTYDQFSALVSMDTYINADERLAGLDVFDEQLVLYGTDRPTSYEPFAILKVVYVDGHEAVPSLDGTWTNAQMFELTNSACRRFDLANTTDVDALKVYFDEVTLAGHMEGVVVKPNDVTLTSALPYMKVRNPRYMTLVYGHDYLNDVKHKRLVARKSIKRKARMSAKEWELGKSLLAIPLADVSADNDDYARLVAEFVDTEAGADKVDPRL